MAISRSTVSFDLAAANGKIVAFKSDRTKIQFQLLEFQPTMDDGEA